nr:hypothetical protein [Dechloromonas sp.]
MLQRASRKGRASLIQPVPGEVCQQTRASLLLLTHQYQAAGRATLGADSEKKRRSRSSRRGMVEMKNCLAKQLQYNYCVY